MFLRGQQLHKIYREDILNHGYERCRWRNGTKSDTTRLVCVLLLWHFARKRERDVSGFPSCFSPFSQDDTLGCARSMRFTHALQAHQLKKQIVVGDAAAFRPEPRNPRCDYRCECKGYPVSNRDQSFVPASPDTQFRTILRLGSGQ